MTETIALAVAGTILVLFGFFFGLDLLYGSLRRSRIERFDRWFMACMFVVLFVMGLIMIVIAFTEPMS